MTYQRCTRCVMDNSIDTTITFDEKGHCNYCSDAIELGKKIYFPNSEGQKKLQEMVNLLKKEGEGKKYDCMMGISGGLDSSYLAYIGFKMGLRILAFHIDDGFDTQLAVGNIRKLCNACHIDLINIVPDAEQYNELTKAFIRAEVPNIAIPQDNILFAELYRYAKKYRLKYFLSGGNFALESIIMNNPYPINVWDVTHIKYINKKFGKKPINKLHFLGNTQRLIDRYFYGIHNLRPLNYIDYNRARAISELKDFCGYEYYEQKHCENILTKVIQLYWLPKKFKYDKRSSHLSSMIISNNITREEALEELEKAPYKEDLMDKDINFLMEKLGMSRKEFDEIVKRPGKGHDEYRTSRSYKIFKKVLSGMWSKVRSYDYQ